MTHAPLEQARRAVSYDSKFNRQPTRRNAVTKSRPPTSLIPAAWRKRPLPNARWRTLKLNLGLTHRASRFRSHEIEGRSTARARNLPEFARGELQLLAGIHSDGA